MSGTPRCYCAASFSVPVRRNDLPPNIRFLTIAAHHESLGRYAKIALDGRQAGCGEDGACCARRGSRTT
jgi:hypothetical protein